jgi:hypothetical protein
MRSAYAYVMVCVALLAAAPSRAQEQLPAYQVLTCEKDCPPVVSAKAIENPLPIYPRKYAGWEGPYIDAAVDVSYTIAANGSVKNIAIVKLLGPKLFADITQAAVATWRYKPATEAGTPVDENHELRIFFRLMDQPPGARDKTVTDYRYAVYLAHSGRQAEAIAAFGAIAARSDINLYERTMVNLALAEVAYQTKDYAAARDAIRIATLDDCRYLEKRDRESAMRLRISLEALNGDFAESFAWFDRLRAAGYAKADDVDQKLIDQLHSMMAAPDALAASGVVPPGSDGVPWIHTLLRRSFEFQNIHGKLDHFDLYCQRHGISSPITEKAAWTVPASWSGCAVSVYGDPGATFRLIELQPS